MGLNTEELKQRALNYIELGAQTKVTAVDFIETFTLFGHQAPVLSFVTTDEKSPEWWVFGASRPINLYHNRNQLPDS